MGISKKEMELLLELTKLHNEVMDKLPMQTNCDLTKEQLVEICKKHYTDNVLYSNDVHIFDNGVDAVLDYLYGVITFTNNPGAQRAIDEIESHTY